MGQEEQVLQRYYQEGYEESLKEVAEEQYTLFVNNLLQQTDFSDERIAALVAVPVFFVKGIRQNQPSPLQ